MRVEFQRRPFPLLLVIPESREEQRCLEVIRDRADAFLDPDSLVYNEHVTIDENGLLCVNLMPIKLVYREVSNERDD
jgi:hypothetical protein